MEELYAESIIHFRRMCEKYMDLLKYVESKIPYQVMRNFFLLGPTRLHSLKIQRLTKLNLFVLD